MSRDRQKERRAERAAVVPDDRLWAMVFAEVVAWQEEHGGGPRRA
jgi:hypothetical protein